MYSKEQIAAALDYTIIKPTTSQFDVVEACKLAEQEKFASVCVRPCDVKLAANFNAPISTVIGFPHGSNTPEIKRLEAQQAIKDGASELDIVMNYSRFADNYQNYVENELQHILGNRPLKAVIKIILEVCYLTHEQITAACQLIQRFPCVSYVKTSTGFGPSGAKVESIEAMKRGIEGSALQIKASGSIRTYEDVAKYLDLGCTRIGCSKWSEICS